LDLISNKTLRFQLGSYYDDEVKRVQESIEDIEYSFAVDWLPIMKEQTVEFKFKEVFDIKDYRIFTGDSKAKTILKINRDNYGAGIRNIDRILKSIVEIEEIIAEELKK